MRGNPCPMNLERDPGFETLAEKSQGSLLDTRVNTGQSVLPLSTSCLDQVSEFMMGLLEQLKLP